MPIAPPKCKTCGKTEWKHRCSGPVPISTRPSPNRKKPKKKTAAQR